MRNFTEIFYKDGLAIGLKVRESRSPRLSGSCAVYEKYQNLGGRTKGFFQTIYNPNGSVFCEHEKFPRESERFFSL